MTIPSDFNAVASWLLRDLAAVQSSRQKRYGFDRAASAIFWLETPLADVWTPAGLVPHVKGVGPSSLRVINELVTTGGSATVERAVDDSGRRPDIEQRRALRSRFLSRAAVRQVLSADGPGPAVRDCQGDFQMHTHWSDGANSVSEMAEACEARGYRYAAITDHAHGLRIARGMSMDAARQQHREIERANSRRPSFRILKGIEANIDRDGQIDLTAAEAREFDLVLAAPHSALRSADDQTGRFLTAVSNPHVRVLAHPRGRMAGRRQGVVADWDRVFIEAARRGVVVELDGDPSRQDLDFAIAARALAAGCLFALDSDAHGPDELVYAETALAHARLAGIPSERIVNCWPWERVRDWLDA